MPVLPHEDLIRMYYSTFRQTEAGKSVLEDLKNKFYRRVLWTKDNSDVMVNVGAHDAVVYIISMVEEFELKERGRIR